MLRKIPSMAKINSKPKKYTGMSFFAGCGGSSTGYKAAGLGMLYSNEFVSIARKTYKLNHLGTLTDGRDIRTVDPKGVMKRLGLKRGELDFMDGSPPCLSFSTAGAKDKGWGEVRPYSEGISQRTDDLFFEYVRMIKAFKPKVFVAENVTGLVQGTAKGYFLEILQALRDCGYKVSARVLNAAYLDVPQARERVIFVGVRNDLVKMGFEPVHPEPMSEVITVRDVLPHVVSLKSKRRGMLAYIPADIPSPTIVASDGTNSETAGFSCGGFVELKDGTRRKYTIDELKKVFTFPEDFKLIGKFSQQWERVGRSVPPMMAYHIARTIVSKILKPYYERINETKHS
jgi:DNA (cytosine-5)-methyltransferase 1